MAYFEVNNVFKRFGGVSAVNGLTLHVEQGQIFGLIGPNGSGKTTIFNLINGYFPVDKGAIFFEGKQISGLKTYEISRRGIGRTFQIVKPLKRMTTFENILTSAFLRTATSQEAADLAEETIDFCGLNPHREKLAQALPIASRKRLEIARALATKPKLLLLDETAAGLNPSELEEAVALIKKVRDSGVTLIIVEHIMKVIMTISDRILAVNMGRAIVEGSPTEVASHPDVISAYLGEDYRAQG